jgi:hypothetical protein
VPHELKLPPALERLCQSVPEEEFRNDVSSTELRNRGYGDAGDE